MSEFPANPSAPAQVTSPPDLTAACQYLRQIDCLTSLEAVPIEERVPIRAAVRQVAAASDYQMLGICADSWASGKQALASYAAVLGYTPHLDSLPIEGPVYIKFNPKTGLCYASAYSGPYRGVLISCQSEEETDVNEMFGHLPLDLFQDEPELAMG